VPNVSKMATTVSIHRSSERRDTFGPLHTASELQLMIE
jgi:hypothetical protein